MVGGGQDTHKAIESPRLSRVCTVNYVGVYRLVRFEPILEVIVEVVYTLQALGPYTPFARSV